MLRDLTIHWFPLLPGWSVALLAAALLVLVAWGSQLLTRKQVPRRWVIALGFARVVSVILFVACLLQPTLSYLHSISPRPELLVLVDTSTSMGQTDDGDQSRLKEAVARLHHPGFLESLDKSFRVEWFAFDRRAFPIESVDLDKLEPAGAVTDFAHGFNSAVELLSAQSDDANHATSSRRVMLVSDGQDRGGADLAEAATRVGATIDVLMAGGERQAAAAHAAIARVQAASRVLLDSETMFLVTIERGEVVRQDYILTLFEDDQPVQTVEVTLDANVRERRISVAHRPSSSGLKRYEFALQPKGEKAAADADERQGVNVQVIDDKVELLVLEDRWRWEFKFFRRVLENDPSFNLTAMLARGGAFMQMGEPERRVNLGSFPQSRAELDWFDVLVLGDVRPSRWPSGLSAAIADSVIEGGKSLIVVAGPTLAELAQVPELHTLLPVELSGGVAAPIEGPLAIQLTPEGARSGLFADGDTAPAVALPAIDRIYPSLRKRPAATVLVEASSEANQSGRLIVLAEQSVGRGKVLFVGTDALWKWQTLTPLDEDGRTLYDKFWQQALRSLAPTRLSTAGLWLQTDRTRYEAGDRVKVTAETMGDERWKLDASVILPDQRRVPLAFEPDTETPGAFVTQFDTTATGRYRLALSASVDGQAVAETSAAIEVTASRGETDDRGVDRARLERIASLTGGKVVEPNDPTTWPAVAESPPIVDQRRVINLWENFTLLTLLCLVLGSDWLVRLLRGYT